MYNFDVEDYMLQGRKAVASRNDCEVMAETLHKRGYSNIVLMGVGGTTAKFMSLQKMIDDYSDVETLIVPADIGIRRKPKTDKEFFGYNRKQIRRYKRSGRSCQEAEGGRN